MTKPAPTSIAFYLRVSRESQDYGSQLHAIRQFCRREKFPEPKRGTLFSEKASGYKAKRTELDRLLQAIRERKFDCVITWRLDRLGRSHVHMVNVHHELKERGVRVIGVADGLDTIQSTAAMEGFRQMLMLVASMGGETIRENVKAGLANAAKQGRFPGRPRLDPTVIQAAHDLLMTSDKKGKVLTLRAVHKKTGLSIGTLHALRKKGLPG